MSSLPVVSIVVPIYNMEKYLSRCLDSLLGQSLEDIEIICVDDGSTDAGPEILARYADRDRRIKIFTQPNQGVAAARNAGLGRLTGRYLASVDPDDWLEPQTCALAAGLLDEDPELDYVAWSSRLVYDGDRRPPEADGLEALYRVRCEGRHAVDRRVRLNTVPNVCNKMLKTDLIRRFALDFPGRPVGEDGGFWHKYAAHARFGHYLDEPLYNYYRGRSDSATSGGRRIPDCNWLSIFADIYDHYLRQGLLGEAEKEFLAEIFVGMYRQDLAAAADRRAVRSRAGEMARDLDLPNLADDVVKYLRAGRDHERAGYSPAEKIFSVKNRDQGKVLAFLGLEFKIGKR